MRTEKLNELVEKSDLNQIHKNIMKGFIQRAEEWQTERTDERALIELIANEKRLDEVVVSTPEFKIYTVAKGNPWDEKFPYRVIFLDESGKWVSLHTVSPSVDSALLVYLEYKYAGPNSQFALFAHKMLDMTPDLGVGKVE